MKPNPIKPWRRLAAAGLLALSTLAAAQPAADAATVVINGHALSAPERAALERASGTTLLPGRWWYDTRSGLWGAEGHGAAGFARPGLDVGAPLPADASAGSTGVFFNGRDLSLPEVAWLKSLGPVWPGRYWLDVYGNVGLEGQRLPFTNLYVLAAQRMGPAAGGNSTTRQGTWVANEGGCLIVSGRSSSGIGSFGASRC